MYILFITRGYPSEKYQMNGIFEFDQAKAITKAGHKVVYAAIDVRSIRRTRKWGYESFKKEGVQIEAINIPCGRLPQNIIDKMRIFAMQKLYKKICKEHGVPDIIHAHFINFGYIVAHLFERANIPLVLTEHFSGINQKIIKPYLTKMGKYTYKRMDQVISVSNYLANNIKEKFDVNSVVIPNIVDTTSFSFYRSDKESDEFHFISTGSLTENKQMDVLIEAFNQAFGDSSHIKLYIYGDGPQRKKIDSLINKYSLSNNIFLMGIVEREEIAKKMSSSDCFVLVSKLETFGVAYIEAMAMGLPVIATKCGGPEDFVSKDNGVLIPLNNISELIRALKYITNNVENYDKKSISDTAKSKFGSRVIARQITDIYENLL